RESSMLTRPSRRRFLATAAMASVASVMRPPPALAAEETLATTAIRMAKGRICSVAEALAAEVLLRAQGFKEIAYIGHSKPEIPPTIAAGEVAILLSFAVNHIHATDPGAPITLLAGVPSGCYELFARQDLRSITELKGKRVGLQAGSPALLRLMGAQVGLDPQRDFQWVVDPKVKPLELFVEGKIDAFLAFPPEPQELRARHAGHVILDTTMDRPWSQYFCCMTAANREYVRRNPVATKRALRALLRAAGPCVDEPAAVAQRLVDAGVVPRYDYALQTVSQIH